MPDLANTFNSLNQRGKPPTEELRHDLFVPWGEVRDEVLSSFSLSEPEIQNINSHKGADWYDSNPMFAFSQVMGVRHLFIAWCSGFSNNRPEWHADAFRTDCKSPVYSFRKEGTMSPYAGFGLSEHFYHYSRESAIQDLIDWSRWYGAENAVVKYANDKEIRFLTEANQMVPLGVFREQAYENRLLHNDRTYVHVSEMRAKTVVSVMLEGYGMGLKDGNSIEIQAWKITDIGGNGPIGWAGQYLPAGRPGLEFDVTVEHGFSIDQVLDDASRCRWCDRRVEIDRLETMPGTHVGLCPECRSQQRRAHHEDNAVNIDDGQDGTRPSLASWA